MQKSDVCVNGKYGPSVELVRSFGDFTPDDTSLAEIGAARPSALRIVERIDFDE